MPTSVRWILASAGLVAAVTLLIVALFWAMTFRDGPLEIIRGGPFKTGEYVTGPEPDWSFLEDRMVVEFQTMTPPRSRIIWLVVVDNRLYVLSSFMKTGFGKIWKQWPHQVTADNRAIMRVDGRLYRRQLSRLDPGQLPEGVIDAFNSKYDLGLTLQDVRTGGTWLYELAPRS